MNVTAAFGGKSKLYVETLMTLDDDTPGRSTFWWIEI
jgi:hypothetical protein